MIRRLWAWLTTPAPAPVDDADLAARLAVGTWLTQNGGTP